VRLGHISLDGTKLRANASKHKAMSDGRTLQREPALAAEVARWLEEGRREDAAEDAEHGPDDDGWSLPDELRESERRLEAMARERAVVAGEDPPDVQRLRPLLEQLHRNLDQYPAQFTADAGYASEANVAALADAHLHAVIALRRYHRDEPPDADPAPKRASRRWPHRNALRERLASADGKALYRLRKQTVEPVFGQIKGARGFRQFLRRGLAPVGAEWALLCTAHNLLKLHQASAGP